VDRPFDPTLLKRAQSVAAQYRIILESDPDVGFIGHGLELPNVFADGPTPSDCVKAVREALAATVATMLEQGSRPPAPAREGLRQTQLNIRVSAEEKLVLEDAARRHGFRGVSDYVRSAALDHAR
jgi:predicted RNase H-like HicB family nuclease